MVLKTTCGKIIKLNLKNYTNIDEKCRSCFQEEIKKTIRDAFKNDIILQEVRIPIENFVFDFFIPSAKIMIECDGQQHYVFNKFFHGTIHKFNLHKDRDERKQRFCDINGIRLIRINIKDRKSWKL